MVLQSPYKHNDVPVDFVFQPSRKDTKHLIVVFTSIRTNPAWLDFEPAEGLLGSIRSNILWIYDNYEGVNSYYSYHCRNTLFQDAVVSLIEDFRTDLGLAHSQCTSVGMSKGGSAALILGIRCNFFNIVSLVPQIGIGSYLRDSGRQEIIVHMAGDSEEESIEWLDSLVPAAIKNDRSYDRNIYLITSPYDEHCVDYLDSIFPRLTEHSNFNIISTLSNDVNNHGLTLRYNVPLVISLLGILTNGLRPRFGSVSNGEGLSSVGPDAKFRYIFNQYDGNSIDCTGEQIVLQREEYNRTVTALEAELNAVTASLTRQTVSLEKVRHSKLGRLQSRIGYLRTRFKI